MTSMVSKANSSMCSSQASQLVTVEGKGSRNKRKFRADPLLDDPNKIIPSPQDECPGYEFSTEKFEATPGQRLSTACDLCGVNQDCSDGLSLNLGLSSARGSSEVGPSQPKEERVLDDTNDADWSDLTESQLEELVLRNLDAIFRSAIKKIVAFGYTEDVATKAILRSGLYHGRKDTVSNIVDNALAYIRNSQDIDSSMEQRFDDLHQLEKNILAQFVYVLREIRPFFSTGDAMWCLLMCDLNVSHACAMGGGALNSFAPDRASNETSSISIQPQTITEAKCSELNLPSPCKAMTSVSCSNCSQNLAHTSVTAVPEKLKNSEKDGSNHTFDLVDKSLSIGGTTQSPVLEEKFMVSRKVQSGATRREYILRQKSLHMEKSYRTHGTKGSARAGKLSGLGGLVLDKKLRSVSDTVAVNVKNASLRLNREMGVDVPQDNGSQNFPSNPGFSSPVLSNLEASSTASSLPKTNSPSTIRPIRTRKPLPAVNRPPKLSINNTELSLALQAKSNSTVIPVFCHVEAPNGSCSDAPHDKSLAQWVPRDKKDEMIMKLLPKAQELQNQLQGWTKWANQKVMQAAQRLSKDKAELKSLRQEKEEFERLKKEAQTLEENNMKKLTEMANALGKASGQVDGANSAVRRLEVENAVLRKEMEAAKLCAVESAASCQEAMKREKKVQMELQMRKKQECQLQEELRTEKRKVGQLLQDVEQAKQLQEQHATRWQQEQKVKEEFLRQASSIAKERELVETSAKSKEDAIKLKAVTDLQKYKDDIQKLENDISQLRLKTNYSKIAALKRGISATYASRVTDTKTSLTQKDSWSPYIAEVVSAFHGESKTGGVKRERECVMCLSEEMSVVFLPCAHQVVCTTCNELHEKQGMKDCPSCRSPIQQRILVRFTRS